MSARAILLTTVALGALAIGCGGRSVGGWFGPPPYPDGGPRDARPQPSDGGPPPGDATVPPVDLCQVPPDPIVVATGDPHFVYSVDAVPDLGYVVGGAVGWGPVSGRIWALHPQTLEVALEHTLSDAEEVVVRGSGADDGVLHAVLSDNQVVTYRRYRVDGAGRTLVQEAEHTLCSGCRAHRSGPLAGDDWVLIATTSSGRIDVHYVMTAPPYEFAPGTSVAGTEGHVVRRDGEPILVFESAGQVFGERLTWTPFGTPGGAQSPATETLASPTFAVGIDNGIVFAGWHDAAGLRQLQLYAALRGGEILGPLRYPLGDAFPNNVWLSLGPGTVGVTWGINFGSPGTGAHFAAVQGDDPTNTFGPVLVSTPVANPASYTIWSVSAPHPDGHVVLWGAWEPDHLYGLYGKILRCGP